MHSVCHSLALFCVWHEMHPLTIFSNQESRVAESAEETRYVSHSGPRVHFRYSFDHYELCPRNNLISANGYCHQSTTPTVTHFFLEVKATLRSFRDAMQSNATSVAG